jgi:hypothetical protein
MRCLVVIFPKPKPQWGWSLPLYLASLRGRLTEPRLPKRQRHTLLNWYYLYKIQPSYFEFLLTLCFVLLQRSLRLPTFAQCRPQSNYHDALESNDVGNDEKKYSLILVCLAQSFSCFINLESLVTRFYYITYFHSLPCSPSARHPLSTVSLALPPAILNLTNEPLILYLLFHFHPPYFMESIGLK